MLNCIGRDNYPYFFKFCLFATLSAVISEVSCFIALITGGLSKIYFGSKPELALVIFLPFGMTTFFGIMMPMMICCGNSINLCEGETIVEKKIRIKEGEAKKGC